MRSSEGIEPSKILAAELRVNAPKLDLHNLRPEDGVEEAVDRFLYDNYNQKQDVVKIVYGIGEGKMEKKVLDFLKTHPLVEEVGKGTGHCLVVIALE